MKLKHIAMVAAALLLSACAGTSTMQKKDMADVPSKTFAASKELVKLATEDTIKGLGYKHTETKDSTHAAQVYFSKPMSAFSWGEVGRIDIVSTAEKTTVVSLASEKRYQLQITGTKEQTFADKIFAGVEQRLAQ